MPRTARFEIVDMHSLPAQDCPCGTTRRAFLDDPRQTASMHLLVVSKKAREHYHEKLTEMYYVLEGSGHLELDGERYPIAEGSAVLIHPGCRHRAVGDLRILVIPVPAFDPADEFFDSAGSS